jgi:hypothetical protein
MLRPRATTRLLSHVPGLRRLPLFKLLAIAEIALLAGRHVSRLTPAERRRLVALLRDGRGRGRNLPDREREELAALVAKVEPRRFAGAAADRLSPVRLPRRIVNGRARR